MIALSIALFIPKWLTESKSYPANATFLHQIAGACLPSDDANCFKQEWYAANKSFEDVKKLYEKYPLNADWTNVPWWNAEERVFKHEKLNDLQKQWIKAIFKYPSHFIAHEWRFVKDMWTQNPQWIFSSDAIQAKATNEWHLSIIKDFPENEKSITFTPIKKYIYDVLYQHRVVFNHLWGVLLSAGAMLISSGLWIYKTNLRNALLLFSFSAGFAGFWSAFFIAIFTPVNETRYMSPILPLGIMAAIGLVAYILDRYKNQYRICTSHSS